MRIAAGVAVLVVGVAGFLVFLLTRLAGFSDSLRRIPAPGEGVVELKAGKQVVYYEFEGLFRRMPELEIEIRPRGGEALTLSAPLVRRRYSLGGRRGESIRVFELPSAGVYEVTCKGSGDAASLAIGPDNLLGILLTVLGSILILGGSIVAGVLLILSGRKP